MPLTRPKAHQLSGQTAKKAVRVVTTSNITLSGSAPATVDGVSLTLDDRILVTAQTTATENGIYRVTTVGSGSNGTWVRSRDANQSYEVLAGMTTIVTEGTTYADTLWKLTTDGEVTLGTTELTFEQHSTVELNSIANLSDVTISSATSNDVLTYNGSAWVNSTAINLSGNITGGNLITTGLTSTGDLTVLASGTVEMNQNVIGNVGTPISSSDAATKSYVDGLLSTVLTVSDGSNTQSIADGDTLTFSGTSNEVEVAVSATDTVTIGLPDDVTLGGGLTATTTVTATGNITGGNLTTAGQVVATGNITGSYFIGNGSQLTGVTSYTDSDAQTFLSSGNVTGANIAGTIFGNTTVQLQDDVQLRFGAGNDLRIYHDGTTNDSYVRTVSFGNLYVQGRGVYLRNQSAENYFFGDYDTGEVTLYKSNSARLTTTTDGVTVTGNITAGNLSLTGVATVGSDLTVTGNLTVNGTTTTINSTTLTVDDKQIIIAQGSADSSAADGAGISVDGADANITYTHSTASWDFNKPVNVTGNITGSYFIGNGSQLTGVTSYTDSDVASLLSNFGANNISTTGTITTTSNIIANGRVATDEVSGHGISNTTSLTLRGGTASDGIKLQFWDSSWTDALAIRESTHDILASYPFTATGNITGGNLLTGNVTVGDATITVDNVTYTGTDGTTGQALLTYGNGVTYFGNVATSGGATYTASTSAPGSPSVGDKWYDTTDDILFEYINDGTSNVWVDVSSASTGDSTTGDYAITGDFTASGNITQGPTGYQSNKYILYGTTTDATTSEIFIGGGSNSRVPVGNNTTMFYTIDIVARRTDTTGESAGWTLKGVVDNFSGNVQNVGNIYEVAVARDDTNWAVDVLADNTDDALNVVVTGAAGKTVKWMATVETQEITE